MQYLKQRQRHVHMKIKQTFDKNKFTIEETKTNIPVTISQ